MSEQVCEILWSKKMQEYFNSLTPNMPEGLRGRYIGYVNENARARGASEVTELDIITALLRNTPVFFRQNISNIPKDIKVDLSPLTKRDLTLMSDDIEKAAKIAEVGCNKDLVNKILNVYEEQFSHPQVAVSFRTTTKPAEKRSLDVRYVDVWTSHDPYAMAIENGLLVKSGHPVDNLFYDIKSNFPIMGYGVDFGVLNGFAKIWMRIPTHLPVPIEKLQLIPSFPDSLKNYINLLSKYSMDRIIMVGIDYIHKSTNIYFVKRYYGDLSTETVTSLISELGFPVPSNELIEECAHALFFYCTFTWDSPKIERLSFHRVAHDQSQVPVHLHPFLEKYSLNAPILGDKRKFMYTVALSPKGNYIKLESDYSSGIMADALVETY